MEHKTDDHIPSNEFTIERKRGRKRLSLWMPNTLYEGYKDLETGISIQSVVNRLFESHLLDLQLKAEFAKLK